MALDRAGSDDQPVGNLPVREPGGDEVQHFDLSPALAGQFELGISLGSPLGKSESEEPNEESGQTRSDGSVDAEQRSAGRNQVYSAQIEALEERRKLLLEQDALGRTPLFYAAEKGLEEEVWEIIFRFRGTGLSPTRLMLITTKDHSGLTAADVAEKNGHKEIARLLRSEQARMEYYE